ncbi:hypothetical protein QZH41_007268 [Actinostola sp. cb2023]|nr:hypothetical protein QZH41_007268 [Actinostola sp. cb2023]
MSSDDNLTTSERLPVEETPENHTEDDENLYFSTSSSFDVAPTASRSDTDDETDNSFIVEAKEKFEKSIECAVKAISNDALKISDRIFAARLRIIGTILRYIDNTPTSLTLCKSYLNQLNSIPEVINNLRVHFGKGTGAALRKKLNADERKGLIWSVVSVNRMMWNYAHLHNAEDSYITDWPRFDIEVDDKVHPVLDGRLRAMFGWLLGDAHELSKLNCPQGISVAPNGCFVVADTLNECIKVFSYGGHYMHMCEVPQPALNDEESTEESTGETISDDSPSVPIDKHNRQINFKPRCIAVYKDLTIYAASSRGRREDIPMSAEVFLFDSKGKFEKTFGKEVFTDEAILTSMVIDGADRLLITDDHANCIHAFSLEGEYLSRIGEWEAHEDYSHIAVTLNGHILITHWDHIRIYDSEGKFASKYNAKDYGVPVGGIAFDTARQQVYVLCKAYKHLENSGKPNLQIFDKEWDFQGTIDLPKSFRSSKDTEAIRSFLSLFVRGLIADKRLPHDIKFRVVNFRGNIAVSY